MIKRLRIRNTAISVIGCLVITFSTDCLFFSRELFDMYRSSLIVSVAIAVVVLAIYSVFYTNLILNIGKIMNRPNEDMIFRVFCILYVIAQSLFSLLIIGLLVGALDVY